MNDVMSYEQFLACANQIIELSNEIKDGWILAGNRESFGHGYMKKLQTFVETERPKPAITEAVDVLEENDSETFCDASVVSVCPLGTKLTWEYHVVYSPSYAVPELFFSVWKDNGVLLTLDEIWSKVPARFSGRLHKNRWDFITQQEHPICRRPFFHLHPCQTPDILRNFRTSRNLLVSWLSTIGCTVGLNIDLCYAAIT